MRILEQVKTQDALFCSLTLLNVCLSFHQTMKARRTCFIFLSEISPCWTSIIERVFLDQWTLKSCGTTQREQRNCCVSDKNYVLDIPEGADLNTLCMQDWIVPYICGVHIRANDNLKYLVLTKRRFCDKLSSFMFTDNWIGTFLQNMSVFAWQHYLCSRNIQNKQAHEIENIERRT